MKKPVNTRLPGSSTQDAAGHPTYIVLDTLDVSTAVNVGQIRTPEELYAVKNNPSGSYVVVADLDLTQEGDLEKITTTFKGTIDFQGHTVTLRASNDRKYLFADNQGTLKNIVLNTGFRDDDDLEEASGFVLNNNGIIENILVRFAECTDNGMYGNESIAGVIHTNGTKGELRNFAIDAEASLVAQRLASYGVAVNNGKIYNGYVYGEPLDASRSNNTPITYGADIGIETSTVQNPQEAYKQAGGIVGSNRASGIVQEVYSVINVKRAPLYEADVEIGGSLYPRYDETAVGSVIGMNFGTTSGVYGYVTLDPDPSETEAYNYGPVIGRNDPATKTNANTYYVADSNYTDTRLNKRVSKLMLNDLDFQNDTMNSVDNGLVFDTENFVQIGYFPHINLPECMPIQDMVELPQVDENEAVDIKKITVVESTDDTAILDLVLNNPGGGEVKSLSINDIGRTKIVSQEQDLRYTNVRIEISEPEKYYSEYDFSKVTVRNNYSGGSDISRTYAEDEKTFQVEFYRGISNTTEWAEYLVKDGTENYKLRADLDFANVDESLTFVEKIDGILNGDGHTVSNVELPTRTALIHNLDGTVKNIGFKNISGEKLQALIYQTPATRETTVHDVQLENITLNGSAQYMGALIAYCHNTEVSNISARHITVTPSDGHLYTGGLIGFMTNSSSLKNSFIQDLEMNLFYGENNNHATFYHYPYGSGGLVGYLERGSSIENCYADGKIHATVHNLGGIVGTTNASPSIKNCYSNVDILTENIFQNDIGTAGIHCAGVLATENQKNLLSLGDLDCNTSTVIPSRACGDIKNLTQAIQVNAWAYGGQKINGKTSDDSSDVAGLLSYEQLTEPATYTDIICLGDAFDYSNVANGYLPMLYREGTTELLPGQDNIPIDDSQDNVSVISVASQNVTDYGATLVIKVRHPLGYKVDSLTFDNLKTTGAVSQQEQSDGVTSNLIVDVAPEKYYDNYRILSINDTKVNARVDQAFYKQISTFEDWQNIDSTSYENYRLINDLTFTEEQSKIMNRNMKVNRFVGPEDHKATLSGITLNLDGNSIPENSANVFDTIESEFGNIRVEDFTLNTVQSGETSSKYDTSIGFIWRVHGSVHDLELENIQINQANKDLQKGQYVGFIAVSKYSGVSEYHQYIKLSNVKVNGRAHVGALQGRKNGASKASTIIYAENIEVLGKGVYVGGIYGNTGITLDNVTLKNATVENKTTTDFYTGGVAGSSNIIQYAAVENCTVISSGVYTGGIVGQGGISSSYIRDSSVKGGQFTGGAVGRLSALGANRNTHVINCDVTGTESVGGVVGGTHITTETYWLHDCGVVNSTVTGENQVGGIAGTLYSDINSCFVRDTAIRATGNAAGGVAGQYEGKVQHTITDNSIEAAVTAENGAAGGIVGYYNIQLGSIGRNDLEISNNIVIGSSSAGTGSGSLGIYGSFSAGGLVGASSIDTYYREWKGNILLSDVTSGSDGDGAADYAIGDNGDNALIRMMRAHNSVSLQGEPAGSVIHPEVSTPDGESTDKVQVVDSNYLSQKENYLALGYKDEATNPPLNGQEKIHYWCFDGLADGNVPNSSLEYFRTRPAGSSITGQSPVLPDGETGSMYQVYGTDLQTWLPIPADANAILLLANHSAELPEAEVFTSGVDSINVEFSGVDDPGESGVFYYLNGDEAQAQPIRSVVTLNYDFAEPLTITITNGVDEEEVIVDPEDYTRKVMTWGEDYYYISGDGSLQGSGGTRSGEFIHLYDGKALTGEGQILDIATGESAGSVNGASIAEETVALQTFEYGGTVVESYGTFSTVEEAEETPDTDVDDISQNDIADAKTELTPESTADHSTIRPMQLLMNSGELGALDGSLPIVKDSLILDSYQEEYFQTVLGTDGVVYDLKDPLHLPDGFNNQNVKYMTNNLHSTSHYVLMEYEDGSLAGYNYVTGETLFEEEGENGQNNVSFLAFARSFFSFNQPVISTEASEVYRELRDFQKELEEAPVEEVMEELGLLETGRNEGNIVAKGDDGAGVTDDTVSESIGQTGGHASDSADQKTQSSARPAVQDGNSQSAFESVDTYIPYYDAEKSEYVLYSTAQLLDADVDEVVSENEKIEASPDLKKYYSMPATAMKLEDGNMVGIVLFVVLIVMIGGGLGYLFIRKRENF